MSPDRPPANTPRSGTPPPDRPAGSPNAAPGGDQAAVPADSPSSTAAGDPGTAPGTGPKATLADAPGATKTGPGARNMLPARQRRTLGLERAFIRLVATGGVVGIGVALGAILAASKVQGWIIGLAVSLLSVVLSAMLWSSRQL
jgi:hypothetical protein